MLLVSFALDFSIGVAWGAPRLLRPRSHSSYMVYVGSVARACACAHVYVDVSRYVPDLLEEVSLCGSCCWVVCECD